MKKKSLLPTETPMLMSGFRNLELAHLLEAHVRDIQELLGSVSGPRERLFATILNGAAEVGMSISLLIRQGLPNAALALGRSLFDRCSTCAYLMCAGSEVFDQYLEYGLAYNLERSKRTPKGDIEGVTFFSELLGGNPNLKGIHSKYLGPKSGRFKSRWTDLNPTTMLEFMETNGSTNTTMLRIFHDFLYDDASEAIHGTISGLLIHKGGIFEPHLWHHGETLSAVLLVIAIRCLHDVAFPLLEGVENNPIKSRMMRRIDLIGNALKEVTQV